MDQELATRAKIAQGVVSRAADPEYGNLTLNTIIRIAAGFDIAFLGKFVPFSELDRWFENLSEEPDIKAFSEEDEEFEAQQGSKRAATPTEDGARELINPATGTCSFNAVLGLGDTNKGIITNIAPPNPAGQVKVRQQTIKAAVDTVEEVPRKPVASVLALNQQVGS